MSRWISWLLLVAFLASTIAPAPAAMAQQPPTDAPGAWFAARASADESFAIFPRTIAFADGRRYRIGRFFSDDALAGFGSDMPDERILVAFLGDGQAAGQRWKETGQTGIAVLRMAGNDATAAADYPEVSRALAVSLFDHWARTHQPSPSVPSLEDSIADGLGTRGWRAWAVSLPLLFQQVKDLFNPSVKKDRYKEMLRTVALSAAMADGSGAAALEAKDSNEFLQTMLQGAKGGEEVIQQSGVQLLWWGPADPARLEAGKQLYKVALHFKVLREDAVEVAGVPMSIQWAGEIAKAITMYQVAQTGGERYAALLDDTRAAIQASKISGVDRELLQAMDEVAEEQRQQVRAAEDVLLEFVQEKAADKAVDLLGRTTQEVVREQVMRFALAHFSAGTAYTLVSAVGSGFLAFATWNVIYDANTAQKERFNAAYAARLYDLTRKLADATAKEERQSEEAGERAALGYRAARTLQELTIGRVYGALAGYQDSERLVGVVRNVFGNGSASQVSKGGRELERVHAAVAVSLWLSPPILKVSAEEAVRTAARAARYKPIQHNNVSFALDTALASNATGRTGIVPPAFLQFRFSDYAIPRGTGDSAFVIVFPAGTDKRTYRSRWPSCGQSSPTDRIWRNWRRLNGRLTSHTRLRTATSDVSPTCCR